MQTAMFYTSVWRIFCFQRWKIQRCIFLARLCVLLKAAERFREAAFSNWDYKKYDKHAATTIQAASQTISNGETPVNSIRQLANLLRGLGWQSSCD
jgi:hypothetical protein